MLEKMFPKFEFTLGIVALSSIAVYQFLAYFARSMRHKLLLKQTALADLTHFGEPRPKGQKLKGTAVICGGSFAGLITARVCHDHFEHVVIVEPEAGLASAESWDSNIPLHKNNRSRVVQYHSIQGFQTFGFMALKKLFPGFKEECEKVGIRILPSDFSKITNWGHSIPSPYDDYHGDLPKTVFSSRPGLETALRRFVIGQNQYPNIEQIIGTVTGITCSPNDPTQLEAVTVRTMEGDEILSAALVVDCTGPARSGLKWLRRAGFGPKFDDDDPAKPGLDQFKFVYDQKLHYTTLEFYLTPDVVNRLNPACGYDNAGMIYGCTTDAMQGGNAVYASRVENDTVYLCCGTRGDSEPPQTLDGIKAFTRALIVKKPIPDWFFEFMDALEEFEDTMTRCVVRVAPTTYIQYHQAPNLPRNWVAIGDSVMTVNPIYGQGCNKAIMGAAVLNTLLRSISSTPTTWSADFSRRFFETQAEKIEPIWDGTKTLDYEYDTTIPIAGESLSQGALLRWYARRMRMVAINDRQAAAAWWHVIMFLAPPIDYFQPGIVAKVLLSCLTNPEW